MKMLRRVLFMISSMSGGGSERQTLLLLKHLDRNRFCPHLYLTHRRGSFLDQVPGDVEIHSHEDAPAHSGFYYPGRALRMQSAHLHSVLQSQKIDVIYDRTFHMSLVAHAPGKSLGIPRVSTLVSPPHRALPLVESRFVWLKKMRLAKAYRDSQCVVAVSKQTADSAQSYYGLDANRLQVILNPVDLDAVQESAVTDGIDRDQRPTLVCVGRISEEKGHRDLIEALGLLESTWPDDRDPLRLWMIGDGPLRSELTSLADRILRRHQVEFLGRQSNPIPWMAVADALVLPSHFEGMPNVVLEAMTIGTPVIATRAGGTVELERDQPTIFWNQPRDPKSIAQAIALFVEHPDLAKQRSDAALKLVHAHHDVRQTTREIESLLSS